MIKVIFSLTGLHILYYVNITCTFYKKTEELYKERYLNKKVNKTEIL